MSLEVKIEQSLDLLNKYWHKQWSRQWRMYICHSGGKDSCVITDLVDRAIPVRLIPIIHNPKNETHAATVQFLYELSKKREVRMVPFDKMEYYVQTLFEVQVDGSRKGEAGRTERSNLVIFNGREVSREQMQAYTDKGKFGIATVFPIYDWTDEEVWQYIREYKVQVSDEYREIIRHTGTTR